MAAAVPPSSHAASPASLGAGPRAGVATAAALVLLVLAILLAYVPAVLAGLGFVSDDFMILQRLSDAGGLRGAAAFFGQSFYDYYRPLGFVSFAADWTLWGSWPAGYHATSILLHLVNTILVFLLARRLLGADASAVAAAVFGLHVVNQEAVFWASARFDLLATAGALGTLLLLGSRLTWRHAAAALLYLAALLSKESVVALPVAAGAYVWLVRRDRPSELARVFAWLGAAGVIYVLCRHASGLPATGGAGRIPKIAVLVMLPLLQLAAAHPATSGIRAWLLRRRGVVAGGAAIALAAAGGLALASSGAPALRGAFSAFGFAALHLLSPVSPEPWLNPLPAWLSLAGLAAAGVLVLAAWRLAGRETPALLAFLLVAALLPVSSMTEGSRYLYLASVPVAMAAAWALSVMTPRTVAPACTLLALVLVASGWQIRAKGRDWLWASDMTARAVSTIVGAAGPGCRDAHIVFATAPVRTRGVYANINHEALAALGECRPATLRTIIRTGYDDPAIDARLDAIRLELRVASYRGGFVISPGFERYATRIDHRAVTRLTNEFGAFEAAPVGPDLVITQQLPPGAATAMHWFVFSDGSLRHLPLAR
ncbi:MAG TPA: hypothetical protein VLN08_04040 [Vicinamibacterales bacterium]|nr:hypothetical protein [Vicinamibacterales bacterium]